MNSTIHFQHRVLRVRFGLEAWSFQCRVCHDGVIEGVSKFSQFITGWFELSSSLLPQLFSVSWRTSCVRYLIFLLWTDTSPTTCRLGWVWKRSFLSNEVFHRAPVREGSLVVWLYNRKMRPPMSRRDGLNLFAILVTSQHIQHTIQPYWCPSNDFFSAVFGWYPVVLFIAANIE